MRAILAAVAAWWLCQSGTPALAAEQNIPSCYSLLAGQGIAMPRVRRELFVVIDQTAPLDQALRTEVGQKVLHFLRPGDRIVLVAFSAYLSDRRTHWLIDGALDVPLTDEQRFYVRKDTLFHFDDCMNKSASGLRALFLARLNASFAASDERLPKSEILGNLKLVGTEIGALRGHAARFMLLVSDMLENSDTASFYGKGQLTIADPASELAHIRALGQGADFHGADVYVIGAGITLKDRYKSARFMEMLEAFWRGYFSQSGARLRGFGAPSLFDEIGAP